MENKGNKSENNIKDGLNKLPDKKVIIIAGIALAVIIAIVIIIVIIVSSKKEDAYRIIKVFETQGEATVKRADIGDIEAYENMVLESGDNIKVGEGKLTLKLDDDKYLYAERFTEFELLASGTKKDSKTTINLIDGSIANEIQNKLNDDSYYEINTPNSTMSVRGTIYYVSTYIGEDGKRYTKVSVFDGSVETNRLSADGLNYGDNVMVQKGNEIIIYDDGEETEFLGDGVREIKYDELPLSVIETLDNINKEHGERVEIPEEILEELEIAKENGTVSDNKVIPKGPFTVTFMYGNLEFATQTVEYGQLLTKPSLQPAPSGHWDYDFGIPVKSDIVISWN